MTRAPFQPAGDKARWRILYDLLKPMSVGDVITYDQMGEALDMDPTADRHAIQMAVRRAAKEYEVEDRHALEVAPNVGYRVVEAERHLDLAKRQHRKAGKALQRGHSKVVNVDLSNVDPEVRSAFQVVAQAFTLQMDMSRRLESNQKKLQATVTDIAQQMERSDAERQEILARLERLENNPPSEETA